MTELFNRAVGQLKDERLEIRLGAILTLGQVCADFKDLSGPVHQLLSTYLREGHFDYGDNEPPADVAEIVRIIARMSQVSMEKADGSARKS